MHAVNSTDYIQSVWFCNKTVRNWKGSGISEVKSSWLWPLSPRRILENLYKGHAACDILLDKKLELSKIFGTKFLPKMLSFSILPSKGFSGRRDEFSGKYFSSQSYRSEDD